MLESHSSITPATIDGLVDSGTAEYTRLGLNEGSLITEVWSGYSKKGSLTDLIGIDDPASFSIQFLISNPAAFDYVIVDAYQRITDKTKYSALVIIKSPETVAVFIPPETTPQPFFLFNSHSRPSEGYNNAYFIGGSADFVIDHLKQIFPMPEVPPGEDPLPDEYLTGEAFLFQSNVSAAAAMTSAGGSRRRSAKRKGARKTHKSRKSRPQKSQR
jgi:hypothetical protein